MVKKCYTCGEEKALTEFGERLENKDGLVGSCKGCMTIYKKDYYRKHEKKIRKRSAEWTRNNKDKAAKYGKLRRELNKEEIAQYMKKYNEDNKESYVLRSKAYYKENCEQIKTKVKAYARTPKGKEVARVARIRHRTAKLEGDVTPRELEILVESHDNFDGTYECSYCHEGVGKYHIDHIKPLAKGGLHTISNLTIACVSCNCSKGAKLLEEWVI